MAILKDTTINGDLRVNGRITPAGGVYYGICDTAASTQNKVVTIPGITELYDGLILIVKMVNNQTYNGAAALNVNGLGAKTIQQRETQNIIRYMWIAGEVVPFIYNASNDKFIIISEGLATTTYWGKTKLTNSYGSDETLAATQRNVSSVVMMVSNVLAIPAEGSSITKSMSYLGSSAQLVRWNFSSSPENQPPCDLSWSTASGSFTITNNGGTTNETIQPVFVNPYGIAVT